MEGIDTAIILAGGLGTRLRPLTLTTPKPLVLIKGRPLIEHSILQLKKHGIKNIILATGYKSEVIEEYFGNGEKLGVNITYSVENEPLGSGGAVKMAASNLDKPFILMWGDNLIDIDFTKLIQNYRDHNTKMIIALTLREDVEHFGVAKLNGDIVECFIEKPPREEAPSNWINAGVFVLDPVLLERLPEGKSSIEKEVFEKITAEGEMSAFLHDGQWFPTDTLEKYNIANENFQALP